jgi:hypothetical protein
MPFTPEQQTQVAKALAAKIKLACASCGENKRQLVPDLFMMVMTPSPLQLTHSGSAIQMSSNRMALTEANPMPAMLPCIVVICFNCGRTETYNAHILGLASDLNLPAPGVPIDVR